VEDRGVTLTKPETLIRNWGEEQTIIRTKTHCGKILRRKRGTKGGFQLHVKEESHYLISGRLRLRSISNGQFVETDVEAGRAWTVPPLFVHQEEALEDSVIVEVSDPTAHDRYAIEPDPGELPSMTDADAIAILHRLRDDFKLRSEDCDALAKHVWARGLAAFVPERV
jgi:mannose-6-phosphate isomerase-like protein (cupin superfamily)